MQEKHEVDKVEEVQPGGGGTMKKKKIRHEKKQTKTVQVRGRGFSTSSLNEWTSKVTSKKKQKKKEKRPKFGEKQNLKSKEK